MDLFKSYKGKNIKIKVNNKIIQFSEIVSCLKEYDISFISYIPFNDKSLEKFDMCFGQETDLQDLYIVVKLLKDFGLQSIFYSGYIDNEVIIGTYPGSSGSITSVSYRSGMTNYIECMGFDSRQRGTEVVSSEIFLSLPFTTTIDYLLKNYFGVVNISDMDTELNTWIKEKYNISNPNNCSQEEAERVTEITCKEKGIQSLKGLEKFKNLEILNLSDNKISDFDLSPFPNLKELDCSYCPVKKLNIRNNSLLEYIRYEGLRGNNLGEIDFSGNPNLKKLIGGQDGIKEIDLGNNPKVEDIDIRLSQNFRFIDVSACSKLKRIRLWGVLVPFVDLTQNQNLEHIEINYLNTYKGKDDEFGPGYPRPFIFVNEDFDKNTINGQDLQYEYYTHLLVRVKKDSNEEKVLQELKEMKHAILDISNVASFHYQIREKMGL